MAQINVTIDDQTSADLDRVAAAIGEVRTVLVRKVIRETIEAHDGGRLRFELDGPQQIEGSLNGLAVQLREGIAELARSTRVAEVRAEQFAQAFTASEKAVLKAQERLGARITENNLKAYGPFTAELGKVRAYFDHAVVRVADAQQAAIIKLQQQIAVVLEATRKPKQQFYLSVGEASYTLRVLAITHLIAAISGLFLLGGLASLWDGPSVWLAARLVDTPARVCRLIEVRTYSRNCTELVLGRPVANTPRRGAAK